MAAVAAVAPLAGSLAHAADYPIRPVRLIVGYGPGSAADIGARIFAQSLSEQLGQAFVVDNRPGSGGAVAADVAIRSQPDGYTLYWASSANAIAASLYDNLNYNFIRDVTPIAGAVRIANVVDVSLGTPVHSIPELIAYAKANPGKLNMASSGNGTSVHLAGALFMMMTGVKMQHVPYRTNVAALTDLMGEQSQVMFDNVPSSLPLIKVGKIRALGVTTTTRVENLPDVPPVAEFVPGYEADAWQGLVGPKGLPAEIVAILSRAMDAAVDDPKVTALLNAQASPPMKMSPAAFGQLIVADTDKWSKVVAFSGARAD